MSRFRAVLFVLHWVLAGLGVAFLILIVRPDDPLRDRGIRDLEVLPQPDLAALRRSGSTASYAPAARRAAPSVVSIRTAATVQSTGDPLLDDPLFRRFFGVPSEPSDRRLESGLGSGVIIDPDGYVLTNYHVVRDTDSIQVALADGRVASGEIVGIDPETDLAAVKIDLESLPAAVVGDSDLLQVGDIVLAIGNPYGVGQTVTQGIVSATGRNRLGANAFENLIQTDAAIYPGNSGGALVNAAGELVGINSVTLSRGVGYQGISFAIPTGIAVDIMRQLIASGAIQRGWLGIEARNLTQTLRRDLNAGTENGILVLGVTPDGPASRAGLADGDIITHIGGEPVIDSRDAVDHISKLKPGSVVAIRAVRGGKPFEVDTRVSLRPSRYATRQEQGK